MNFIKNANNSLTTKFIVAGAAIVGLSYVAVKLYSKNKRIQKRKAYPKNVVILHQFPRALRAPNASNYCLKLETWLRIANIPYQNDPTFEFSSKGKMPWITLITDDADTEIADSQFCIEFLSKQFNVDLNSHLDKRQKAIAWAFLKMTEESLDRAFALHRYIYRPNSQESSVPDFYLFLAKDKVKKGLHFQGYARHSKDESYGIGKTDIKALSDLLGENKYMLGDKICDTDATIFGMLCQIIYHSRGIYYEYVYSECPNLIKYVERIKDEYWKDWNEHIIEKEAK